LGFARRRHRPRRAQSIGGQFDIAWQIMAGHIVFLIVLALRPQGLFPKY
jgi:branched-chain amino acid transport system permease protein